MPTYKLEPDENLMQFAARFGVSVSEIWNYSENSELRDKFGNPWLVGPGEDVSVPERPGTGRAALTGKLQKFQAIPPPDIIEVYLGFMDEEVNARLAKLIENEDKKSEIKKRPVILIERGKLSKDEPILEWRLGNYKIGEKETPIREILHVSPRSIPEGAAAPENLLARMMGIYMEQVVRDDKDLKEKKIVVCKSCGISRLAGDKYCEHCGISNSSNKCGICGLSYMDYFPSMPGCKHGMSHKWKKCTGEGLHKWKEIECKPPDASHVWVEQTGVEFRRAFDMLEFIGHRKPGKSKSNVPVSEAEIDDGPWLSVVRFDIGPDNYEKSKDIRAPVIVIRTPEMGLQPSLMQPYIEFLFKCISGAASQLASEKDKLRYKEQNKDTSPAEVYAATEKTWEWPLKIFQFGAQGSCSAQEKYSPGKIITVIASLFVGVDIDKNGDTWAVISLCTPGGIYEFLREKYKQLFLDQGGNAKVAEDQAARFFRLQADKEKHGDLKLSEKGIFRDPNNPYKNDESEIKKDITLKETIEKINTIYENKYKNGKVPGVVTLTVSYFGGPEDKKAADELGIYSVGMEDYHVLRILRSSFCQGISKTTDYPIVLGWRIDRVQCDPKEIDPDIEKEFIKYIRRLGDFDKPNALMTADEYADVIVWGLKGLITTAMPECTRWNFVNYYWEKGGDWQLKLKQHFWSFAYYRSSFAKFFIGEKWMKFIVPNPFHIEIATDLLEDLSKLDSTKKNGFSEDAAVIAEVKRLVSKVRDEWTAEEMGRHEKSETKAKTWQKKPVRIEEKRYYGPEGSATKKAAIELMEYLGEKCNFYSGIKRNEKRLLKTWLRANKWGVYPDFVRKVATQDLDDNTKPNFDGSCVDRAFYKSCNMMALQTMAGNLWDIYEPMEADSS
jgi:hypothetical protein